MRGGGIALLIAAVVSTAACKGPAARPAATADNARSPTSKPAATPAPAAPAPATPTAVDHSDRRRIKPAVIGGCRQACDTPAETVGLLADGLANKDIKGRVGAIRALFDWSLLFVDGVDLGARWAEMWGDYRRRGARDAAIDAWLTGWAAWADRVDEPDGLVRMKMGGIALKKVPGRSDTVVVRLRHPKMKGDAGEPVWRLELTLRGYEWLISRIEHRPGAAVNRPAPRGSSAPGRL